MAQANYSSNLGGRRQNRKEVRTLKAKDEENLELADLQSEQKIECASCEQTFFGTEVYRCGTCSTGNSNGISSDLEREYLCEMCVACHIRKNHEVVDYKGYRPAICDEHKIISSMYCTKCEVAFCFKCNENHSKHRNWNCGITITQQATTVRAKIFDYLAKFDSKAKQIALKKNSVEERYPNESDYCTFSAEQTISDISDLCQKVLQKNSATWESMLKKKADEEPSIRGISDRANRHVSTLRSMLSMSDGVCVSKFSQVSKDLDSSIREQDEVLASTLHIRKWNKSLENVVEDSMKKLIGTLNMQPFDHFCGEVVKYEPCGFQKNSFQLSRNNYPGVFINGHVFNLDVQPSNNFSFTSIGSGFCTEQHMFQISTVKSLVVKGGIIVCQTITPSQIREIAIHEKSSQSLGTVSAISTISIDPKIDLIDIFDATKFSFVVWNKTLLRLEILPNKLNLGAIHCPRKPLLMDHVGNIVAYVDDSNKLTIADFESGRKIEVSQDYHGLSKIDHVEISIEYREVSETIHRTGTKQTQTIPSKQIHLADFEKRFLIRSNFSLDSVTMDWHVTRVMKLEIPGRAPILSVNPDKVSVSVFHSTLDAPIVFTANQVFGPSNSNNSFKRISQADFRKLHFYNELCELK